MRGKKSAKIGPLAALQRRNAALLARLQAAEDTLRAIRRGEVDALVVRGSKGEQTFALKGADHTYRIFLERMAEGAATLSSDGTILYCNRRLSQMLRTPISRITGASIFDFLSPVNIPEIKKLFRTLRLSIRQEITLQGANGSGMPVSLSVSSMRVSGTRILCLLASDMTERELREENLSASLREKDVLLKEVHHRVKNNLQVISSLLSLQSRQLKDEGALRALQESRARVQSMALIHQRLYQSPDYSRIDFSDYMHNLAAELIRSYRIKSEDVVVRVDAEPVTLGIDIAVPLGLVLNELVSNTFKYAFPDGRKGNVSLQFARRDGQFYLSVIDDGVGLPEGFRLDRASSLGMQIVRALTAQLKGKLEVKNETGVSLTLHFRDSQKSPGSPARATAGQLSHT